MKKWIAKRIMLESHGYFYNALIYIVDPFIKEIKKKYSDIDWYCSRKTEKDGSRPSIRIYLNIPEDNEKEILSSLDDLLKNETARIGWLGSYDNPDPFTPNPQKKNLKQIQNACELSLSLMVKHPCVNKEYKTSLFIRELTSNLKSFYKSLKRASLIEADIIEAIHFVANNLGLPDNIIYYYAIQA